MKTLIIGIDGADWKIIKALWEIGELPTLKTLADNGCAGILRSTIPAHSPPAWASMVTGVNPGKHGIFDFLTIDENYHETLIQPTNQLSSLTFWHILNGHGISTGIVNIPILYPPEPLNGFMVCGTVTPSNSSTFTYPSDISQEIGNPGDNWIIGKSLRHGDNPEQLIIEAKQKTQYQADMTLELFQRFNPELLMVVFDGSDRLQHFCWKYWDTSHPNYEPSENARLHTAIPDYYINLDSHLARMIRVFENSNIVVVSDHGFTSAKRGFYIEKWLIENGYLQIKPQIMALSTQILATIVGLARRLRRLFKFQRDLTKRNTVLDGKIQKIRTSLRIDDAKLIGLIDWDNSKVFLAGINSRALKINLKGREKHGSVNPGDEYEALITELKEKLMGVIDPETGRPIFQRIYHRDEIYHGSETEHAPDLILVFEDGYGLQEGPNQSLFGSPFGYGRNISGVHRQEGIFIASGPNIIHSEDLLEADIVDILPTILYLNNLPVPKYMDGDVMVDIVREEYLFKNPVERSDQFSTAQPRGSDMTQDEKELLEKHLRALGYF